MCVCAKYTYAPCIAWKVFNNKNKKEALPGGGLAGAAELSSIVLVRHKVCVCVCVLGGEGLVEEQLE